MELSECLNAEVKGVKFVIRLLEILLKFYMCANLSH